MILAYDILLSEEAEKDLFEAYDWYEKQRINLGSEFEMCLEAELNRIARNPQIVQEKYRNVRVVYIRRFPYGVHYLIDEKTIKVIAVFHTHKDPTNWDNR